MARRPSSVRPSVNFCANRFFSQANGRIATKLSQDGLQVSVHPGCAQGQGHVIPALSWILGMIYSVIDGPVLLTWSCAEERISANNFETFLAGSE